MNEKSIKKKVKNSDEYSSTMDYMSQRRKIEPLGKEINKIRKDSKKNLFKQINTFLEKRDVMFSVYDDQFIDFDENIKEKIKQTDELITDVLKLINFFKKKISKKSFVEFFTKDICIKCKNVIFFNGHFMYLPDTKVRRSPFREQKGENYQINILNFLISYDYHSFRDVNIFSGYSDRFLGGRHATMTDITKAMNKFLVAPGLRQIPKRYFVKGLQTDYVGPSAENLGELLANPEINKATNKWFEKLEIPYKVDIQKSGNYYEIIFLPKNSKIKISSMHIGLGYPLILPFIVQCIIAKNKIILIEEPEVHLHPKIEADLADLIVESSLLRNNQFIIETHSEDFLLRILKSIRKEKLKPEHVSVNYIIPNEKKGSKINKININKYGQYTTPWQDNLFAERRREFSNK
ncbi:MAG: AAA family ATPase [Candidatus Pelagibacter sp.]